MKILYCDETSLSGLIFGIAIIVILFALLGYLLFIAMSSTMAKVLSVIFIVTITVLVSVIIWQSSFYASYYVVLTDDYPYEELVAKYVIEDQKGEIYVIHEKNGIDIMDDAIDGFLFEEDDDE